MDRVMECFARRCEEQVVGDGNACELHALLILTQRCGVPRCGEAAFEGSLCERHVGLRRAGILPEMPPRADKGYRLRMRLLELVQSMGSATLLEMATALGRPGEASIRGPVRGLVDDQLLFVTVGRTQGGPHRFHVGATCP